VRCVCISNSMHVFIFVIQSDGNVKKSHFWFTILQHQIQIQKLLNNNSFSKNGAIKQL